MQRTHRFVEVALAGAILSLGSCSGDDARPDDPTGGNDSGLPPGTGDNTATDSTDDDTDDGDGPNWFDTTRDVGSDDGGPDGCDADTGCTNRIDLLFVIDNSGTMGEEQLNLAKNFPLLISRLESLKNSEGELVQADVQIMVTTTDFGNPECDPWKDHAPEKGAPISTSCLVRIDRFTGVGEDPPVLEEACTEVCPNSVAPTGDPFIHFTSADQADNNIPDTPPADVNNDGTDDSEVAQALACVGPQGINGCGYEAPLETMLQALNPDSAWNQGSRPFLRDNATLAIAVITDEADCSVRDWTVMNNPDYQETHPTKNPQATSAVCWNAGVTCDGPDANGVYSDCRSSSDDKLHSVERYTGYLIQNLREQQQKEVIMLGILGVPPVTEHNPEPPYQPTAGGVFDLVYRTWVDQEYPAGDILPDEWAADVRAADKEWEFGIGPGCTGVNEDGAFTGQAVPPVRVKEVCESLNYTDQFGEEQIRCCIESICDTDFSPAIECLTAIIAETLHPPE